MKNKHNIINYKLFMIDADGALCKYIRKSVYDIKKCQYIGYASNGISGLYSIMATKPDIIILDYTLPELDGISLLDKIRNMIDYYPYIIMFCGLGNEIIIQQVIINGANVCRVKPFNIEDFINIIKDSIKILDSESYKSYSAETKILPNNHTLYINEATIILQKISMPPHIKGYSYFRDAIVSVVEDPTNLEKIVGGIYKTIAKNNNTTIKNVERTMRHAVESTWNRCKVSAIEEIFGNTVNENMDKPSNSELIATLADIIRVKHGLVQ